MVSPIVSLERTRLQNFAAALLLNHLHQSGGGDHVYDGDDSHGGDADEKEEVKALELWIKFLPPTSKNNFFRGRKIELADFPEELEDGVEEMVVRSTYFFCNFCAFV